MGKKSEYFSEKRKFLLKFRTHMENWCRPESELEKNILSEVVQIPLILVHKVSDEQIKWMGMKANECHANCEFYERKGGSEYNWVIGWLFVPDTQTYTLHSVIESHGVFFCITPSTDKRHDAFYFVPDPNIKVEKNSKLKKFIFERNGEILPDNFTGLRVNPEETRKALNKSWESLNSPNGYRDFINGF